jgi:hypothetical protein
MTLTERLAAGILAEHASTATRHAGPCAYCRGPILAGHRYATLLSGKRAHIPCIGDAALADRSSGAGA